MSELRGAISSLAQGGPFLVTRTPTGTMAKGVYTSGPAAHTIVDDVVEAVDATADTLTLTAHGLATGDGPVRFTTAGIGSVLPGGIALLTDYWIVKVDANKIALATSLEIAMSQPVTVDVVDITDAGVGTHTLADTADTMRQNQTTLAIVASIQPVTGAELRDTFQNQRTDEVHVVYTKTPLYGRTKATNPDVVTYRAEPWVVFKVEQFDAFGDTHYRAHMARTESP